MNGHVRVSFQLFLLFSNDGLNLWWSKFEMLFYNLTFLWASPQLPPQPFCCDIWSLLVMFSNKSLRSSKNSWIYTEVKLQADVLHLLIRWLGFIFGQSKSKGGGYKYGAIFVTFHNRPPLCAALPPKIPTMKLVVVVDFNIERSNGLENKNNFCSVVQIFSECCLHASTLWWQI